MTSPDHIDSMIDKAKPYYDETLPYHGWHHAEEVIRESEKLIDRMGAEGQRLSRHLARLAAAWHDAGHEDERANEFASKEHYAVWLVKDQIGQELNGSEIDVLERAILATRFDVERLTAEEIILHYADIANMGYAYEDFLEHTTTLWREYGSPMWSTFLTQAEKVIRQSADEGEVELARIGLAVDGDDSFPVIVRSNLERLKLEPEPQ